MEELNVRRTEDFFVGVQKAREALKRMYTNPMPVGSQLNDRIYFDYMRLTDYGYSLKEFNQIKRRIKLLTPSGRWCTVPAEVEAHLEDVVRTEKEYAQFY